MRIAEIIKDKQGNEKIILFFTDKKLNTEIKKIKSCMYYQNHRQFVLLNTKEIRQKLKELEFLIIKENKNRQYKIRGVIISNNLVTVLCDKLSCYYFIKEFIQFNTKNCIKNKKFDFSKAEKIEFWKELTIDNTIYKAHTSFGTICHLENFYLSFPIGLKKDLYNLVERKDWFFPIQDNRIIKKFKYTDDEIKNCLGYLELYEEQIQVVKECFKNVNGIVKAPTGAGKSEIFIALTKLLNEKTLILTTSIDLATQTQNRFLQAKLNCGIVQGNNIDENHKIVIATIQSSHKLKNKYNCVIVDECHEISEIHEKILSDENIIYRFGFSATPFTKDKIKNLIIKQYLGEIIYEIDSKILQEKNRIAIPYINMIKIKNDGLHRFKENNNWRVIEKLFITENYERNIKVVNLCTQIKEQKMILVKKIIHGKILERLFLEKGIQSIFLEGSVLKEEREKVLKEYDKNKNEFVLIGSKILFTGINLQNIFHLFYLAGGKSNIEVIQSLGRGLRSNTKLNLFLYDFYDCGNNTLEKHSKERIKLYKENNFENIKIIEE